MHNIRSNSLRLERASLAAFLIFLFIFVAGTVQAAVTVPDGWTNRINTTGSSPQSFTYTISAGSNRLLVVAITTEYGSTGTRTYSATYGGKSLTMIAQYNTGRDNTWVGYLKEADITARSGNTIQVTYSGGPTSTKVFVASYQNVDQTFPITDSNANGSSSASSVSFGRNITIANGNQLFYVAQSGSSWVSQTPPSGYTELLKHTGNGISVSVGHRNSTLVGSENKTVTFSSSGGVSIVVASLIGVVAPTCTAAAPTLTVTPSAQTITTNGRSINYTVNVKNNDTGSGCSSTTFNLALTDSDSMGTNFVVPSVLSSTSISLAPGANTNVTMTVKAKTGVTSGRDTASVTVTATGHTNAASSATTTIRIAPASYSIWDNTATPSYPSWNDQHAYEVGVKFRSDVNGYITGLRFYKGPGNTGTHIGNLWTSTGTLLASVTFTNETASGWQQVALPNPVPITANTTYVASYYDPAGNYAVDTAYFATSDFYNPPLRALANGVDGPNGLYKYGADGFPNLSYNSNNYWVDVVFGQ